MTDKIYGVIDVGSNSVRLMLSDGRETLSKNVCITKLAFGLEKNGMLTKDAIERTAQAVRFFVEEALSNNACSVYVFATAAVRTAKNGKELTRRIFDLTGIETDIVSGDKEAELGGLGALNGKDGAILDIGGASTEVSVIRNGVVSFTKSINVGCVTLTEKFGQDHESIKNFLKGKIKEFGALTETNFKAIGGTATSLASILIGEVIYSPSKVNGYILTKESVSGLEKTLCSMSVLERENVKGLQKERAEVICSGLLILQAVINHFNLKKVVVSEQDNLEGYLMLKDGKNV